MENENNNIISKKNKYFKRKDFILNIEKSKKRH